jgi:AraC-like DNA-binding protein
MPAEPYQKVYLYRRIVQAKLYIDRNYAQSIDVSNISDEAHFSKFHFIRLFKKAYGRTPHQYLIFVRVEQAKDLLKAGNSVSDVCFSVGFESVTSFSGLFKRIVGLTPSAFWEQHQQKQAAIIKNPFRFVPGCFIDNAGWAENSNFGEVGE